MGFMSDVEAKQIAKRIFCAEDFDHFVETLERMRHLQDCIAERKPSDLCRCENLEENLRWCRVGLKIEECRFDDYFQRILNHMFPQ